MSLENLLVFLLFGFVALFGLILPWLRKRLDDKLPRSIEPDAPEGPPRLKIPPRPTRAPSRYREGPIGEPSPAPVPPAAIRRQARSPVRSLRDARRGIVLMTLLGPCRALEPHDPNDSK